MAFADLSVFPISAAGDRKGHLTFIRPTGRTVDQDASGTLAISKEYGVARLDTKYAGDDLSPSVVEQAVP